MKKWNKKQIACFGIFLTLILTCRAQTCSLKDASGCYCKDTALKSCYLLPDLTVSSQAVTDSLGFVEYPQTGAGNAYSHGSNDGRIRITLATPNIGHGPVHILGIQRFVCGKDTFDSYPGECPGGKMPSQLILQRIYQKDGDTMRYSDRLAGTMTYHPVHGHIHVDDWTHYSLRIKNPSEPDPLKWPVIGKSGKIGYCLMDVGSCSFFPGWCRDNKDSVLLDPYFPNSGLGKFPEKFCEGQEQGISSGYLDVYSSDLYGMWIDIPPGICNGNYYLVLTVDPFNHFTEADDNNNVIAVPVTLKKQNSLLPPLTRILPDKPLTICKGDSVTLTAPGALSYTWSGGEAVQSIAAKTAGRYVVKFELPCGIFASDSVDVSVVDPPPAPVLESDTICMGDSARFASSGGDTLVWYGSPEGGAALHKGPVFTTPPLTSSRTYYAEKVSALPEKVYHAAKTDTGIGGKYLPQGKYLTFDCTSDIILDSVTFFAASDRTDTIPLNIALHDEFGSIMDRSWFHLKKGKNTVFLGFKIPPGKAYRLFFPNRGDSIFSNTGGFYYPIEITGIISVNGSSEGKDKYFYFYDWVIRAAGKVCGSGRIPVTAVVDTSCSVIGIPEPGRRKLYTASVVPNPFKTSTVVQVEAFPLKADYVLRIMDLTGREIVRLASGESKFILQRGVMASGLYLYRIDCNNTLLAVGKLMAE